MSRQILDESGNILPDPIRTPSEVQSWFRAQGMAITEWAAQHGFSPALVYVVMKGRRKCLRGESHRIAVALGLKAPISQSRN